jgi:SapC
MAHTVLLNNIDHRNLRVITTREAVYGDGVMFAVTFPAEFRNLQAHYPIVFRKSPDGTSFEPIALFGFQDGQNLFLGRQGWEAAYLPLAIERLPFYIGTADDEPVVHIDLESPRLSTTEGEAIFLTHGGSSEFLERMTSVLLAIHQGLQSTPAFIGALLEHDLLEPFVFDVERADGANIRMAGLYTIHEERLRALGGQALERLSRAGHLQAAYMALASLSQFRALIDRQDSPGSRAS